VFRRPGRRQAVRQSLEVFVLRGTPWRGGALYASRCGLYEGLQPGFRKPHPINAKTRFHLNLPLGRDTSLPRGIDCGGKETGGTRDESWFKGYLEGDGGVWALKHYSKLMPLISFNLYSLSPPQPSSLAFSGKTRLWAVQDSRRWEAAAPRYISGPGTSVEFLSPGYLYGIGVFAGPDFFFFRAIFFGAGAGWDHDRLHIESPAMFRRTLSLAAGRRFAFIRRLGGRREGVRWRLRSHR